MNDNETRELVLSPREQSLILRAYPILTADLAALRSENKRLREALQDAVHLINTMASNPALSGRVFADFDRTPLGMKICAALAPAAKEQ